MKRLFASIWGYVLSYVIAQQRATRMIALAERRADERLGDLRDTVRRLKSENQQLVDERDILSKRLELALESEQLARALIAQWTRETGQEE